MTPREVAAVLREVSQLLQLKGENAFKVRAYDLAADAFETLPPDPAAPGGLYERVAKGTLTELSGVGKAIDQKVTELVRNGKLDYLEKLRLEFPKGAHADICTATACSARVGRRRFIWHCLAEWFVARVRQNSAR